MPSPQPPINPKWLCIRLKFHVGLNGKDRQRSAKIAKMAKMPNKDGKDEFNLAKMGQKSHTSPIPV